MYKIQTAKIIEHPLIIAYPYWNGITHQWTYNTNIFIDDNNSLDIIRGTSTLYNPFSPIGFSGTSYSTAYNYWSNTINDTTAYYYDNYVRPFMVNSSFIIDNYTTVFKNLYLTFLQALNFAKTNYYDISVGEDEVGDTWQRAVFDGYIPEFRTECYRTKLIQGINKNKLNIITTNESPTRIRCYFKDASQNIMTFIFNIRLTGEHKELNPITGELIRTPISDSQTLTYRIPINN